MIATIHQPQYLPWLGYFDKADRADIFIILDNVQYKKNDWQNRNRIRTSQGWQWLTVPVTYDFGQKIMDIKINNNIHWRKAHFKALTLNYSKAAYFKEYIDFFEDVYRQEWTFLAEINMCFFEKMIEWFGIDTRFVLASEYETSQESTQRLIDLCQQFNVDHYLSGADGKKYMDFQKFEENNIQVDIQDFQHLVYTQLWGNKDNQDFISHMSALDLLFNHGPNSLKIIRGK